MFLLCDILDCIFVSRKNDYREHVKLNTVLGFPELNSVPIWGIFCCVDKLKVCLAARLTDYLIVASHIKESSASLVHLPRVRFADVHT